MKVCIDSNAYIDLLRGKKAVIDFLAQCDEIVVPAAVVAELAHGFQKARNPRAQTLALERFLSRPGIVFQAADQAIAMRWGFLTNLLRRKGRPIPVNDIWIAATAFETGTTLLSYDHHFDAIESLPRIAP